MPPMIEIKHLRKEYKDLVAIKDLSLTLDAGDIFGFIGPNGAGKTTTIKILATLLTPTSGVAYVDGVDVVKNPEAVRSVVGYMPDFFGVYDDIKVWEYLDFFAAAYRIPRDKRPKIIDDVLTLTDLNVKKDAYVESLSRGMKQRLCLAKTLVHDPKVLLLDEPASGLDPRARIEIRELLKALKEMGKTIIVSSHILPELADFCNKIGIIEKGVLLESGDVTQIVRRLKQQHILEIKLATMTSAIGGDGGIGDLAATTGYEGGVAMKMSDEVHRLMDVLAGIPDVQDPKFVNGIIQAAYVGEPDAEWRVLNTVVESGAKVLSFGAQATDLEDVFLSVTKGIVS